jgi:hypothetical protein
VELAWPPDPEVTIDLDDVGVRPPPKSSRVNVFPVLKQEHKGRIKMRDSPVVLITMKEGWRW